MSGIPMLIVAILISCTAMLGQTRPGATQPSSITVKSMAPMAGAGYLGAEACRSCHKAESQQYTKTRHAALSIAKDSLMNCETCHGPGKPHVDAVQAAQGDDAKISAATKLIFSFRGNPQQNSARCQQCHSSSSEQSRFLHSPHATHGVACNSCHATHLVSETPRRAGTSTVAASFFSLPKLPEERRWLSSSLLKKSQPELCYTCHGNVQAQFTLPAHHRVPEGAMKCSDCHNTHGSSNRATLRQTGWETCVNCHVEKRGPFVFEHSAVKVEGCTACHTPHGSVNKMLLNRREERLLCIQCHVNPTAINVPHSKGGFQTRGDCTRCHSSIHGSNFDPAFLH
jgi:predicted CXXCH cytochrome family protein